MIVGRRKYASNAEIKHPAVGRASDWQNSWNRVCNGLESALNAINLTVLSLSSDLMPCNSPERAHVAVGWICIREVAGFESRPCHSCSV
jgi:hypothetical protein